MANKFEEKQGVVNTLSPVAFIQEGAIKEHWDKDEYTLAKLGYKQGEPAECWSCNLH